MNEAEYSGQDDEVNIFAGLDRIKVEGTSSDRWERERNRYQDITQPEKIQQQQLISFDFEEPLADHTETSMVKTSQKRTRVDL